MFCTEYPKSTLLVRSFFYLILLDLVFISLLIITDRTLGFPFRWSVMFSKIKATSLLLPLWLFFHVPGHDRSCQFFRLAFIALFSQYMNCAVSNLLFSVCHRCFTPLFLGSTFAGCCSFLSHYSKGNFPRIFSRSSAAKLVLRFCFSIFPSGRQFASYVTSCPFPSSVHAVTNLLGAYWRYESIFDLFFLLYLMPDGVLADIPILPFASRGS